MKIVYSNIIPFPGFAAINLFGVLFVRKDCRRQIDRYTLNHEEIHSAQQKEMLYIGFYIWYFFEWVYRLLTVKRTRPNAAYYALLHEKEAYENEYNLEYLKTRKPFAWLKRK